LHFYLCNSSERSTISAYTVRVVSFDLDNTLWNTSATIDAANDALAQHMHEQLLDCFNITIPNELRVEKVMGTLFNDNKAKYAPVEGEKAKSPVLLTQLRKDAINQVVCDYLDANTTNKDHSTILEMFVDTAFDVWTKARHDAISQQLTPSTDYVMKCLQSLVVINNNPHTKVLIGAITDGNSNPKLVPELSNVFDFYVNAEMVGIGKPDKRIYIQAAKEVFTKYPTLFQDLISTGTMIHNDDQIEEWIGPWWVHIGDDFIKDIVASNSLKMRNIWTRELLRPKNDVAPPSEQEKQPPQRKVDELMQLVNEKKVVEMSIGTDTYLADTVSSEFATAVVDELRDVVSILQQWQNDASASSVAFRQDMYNTDMKVSQLDNDVMSTIPAPTIVANENVKSTTKFCIACGTTLPVSAKFCSACGEAQCV
jgi:FMN phosphatase YigB (HAD superfamily)